MLPPHARSRRRNQRRLSSASVRALLGISEMGNYSGGIMLRRGIDFPSM